MMKSRYMFRAKGDDEETKDRWFYGGYAKLDDTTFCFKEDYDVHPENTKHYIIFQQMTDWGLPNRHLRATINPETLGQWTGLTDIAGAKIFEGDIVSEKRHYVNSDKLVYQKIQWKKNYSCWLRGEYQRLTPKNIERYKIKVVGNIYDNSELLEAK